MSCRQRAEPDDCWCEDCWDAAMAGATPAQRVFNRHMHLCPDCGNKRCPRATSHELACTGSNEPGQVGSNYQ